MQAGGTLNWKHEKFKPNEGKVGRYLFDKDNRDWKPRQPLLNIDAEKVDKEYKRDVKDLLTMSVTDLSKIGEVKTAYNNFAETAL